jgi:hypothetical protein
LDLTAEDFPPVSNIFSDLKPEFVFGVRKALFAGGFLFVEV